MKKVPLKKRNWMQYPLYGLLFALCFFAGRIAAAGESVTAMVQPQKPAYLAIVIDDFGYNGEGTEEMLALPIPFTAAVMPFSEHSKENAAALEAAGKEAIIHMPMESLTGDPKWVGEKGIFRHMGDTEIRCCVNEAFAVVPKAVGMNNHMGSAIMEDRRVLEIIMEEVGKRGGFFLDSMTSPKTVGAVVAGEKNIPFLQRDVFLDSTDSLEVVKQNVRKAAEVAKKKGYAIAIGHVGPEGGKITAQALLELYPELTKEGVEFVPLHTLVQWK